MKYPDFVSFINSKIRWVQLLLASSERSWASAMAMKSSQSTETTQKAMPGSTKRQIVSRLRRSILFAQNLVTVLQDRDTSKATIVDELEAKAYLSLLTGSLDFEKLRWDSCIRNYSMARIIYATLGATAKTDLYKDLISSIVDPSIRYAAYQMKMPRTKAIPEIAVENFPTSETQVQTEIKNIDSNAFEIQSAAVSNTSGPKSVPSSISWRNRTVKLEDASIAQALGTAQEKEDELSEVYSSFQKGTADIKDLAALYEEIITARQDSVDATKTAIDELVSEGVDPGDSRMQSLQITRTAASYAVIEWRVGRNRILCGPQDGLTFEPEQQRQAQKPRRDGQTRAIKEESSGRKLSRLRERVALYDSILQNLEAVKELPGIIADTGFVQELDAKRAYFRALKCLAIGHSHAIHGSIPNALALYARALDLLKSASTRLTTQQQTNSFPKLDVLASQTNHAIKEASTLVMQYRGLADLKLLSSSTRASNKDQQVKRPFIETLPLEQFDDNVDLTNLVNYPPKLQPVPVKPLFFDLAWNYIQYPGHEKEANGAPPPASVSTPVAAEKKEAEKPKGKGWFGFGR